MPVINSPPSSSLSNQQSLYSISIFTTLIICLINAVNVLRVCLGSLSFLCSSQGHGKIQEQVLVGIGTWRVWKENLWYKWLNAGFWWLTAIQDVVYDYKSQNSSWSFACVTFVSTIIPYEATLNISNCGVCNLYRNLFVWISWMYVAISVLLFSVFCYSLAFLSFYSWNLKGHFLMPTKMIQMIP